MSSEDEDEINRQDVSARYLDERTKKRIHEHLANQHDQITEEDIKNASTGIVVGMVGTPGVPQEELSEAAELPPEKDFLEGKVLEDLRKKQDDEGI